MCSLILIDMDHVLGWLKMNQLVARKTLEKQWKNIQLTIAENGAIASEKSLSSFIFLISIAPLVF